MSAENTDPTENLTYQEAHEQLADDKQAATDAMALLAELQQRLSGGDRSVTQDELRDARAAVEHAQLQVEGSERVLRRVAQRHVEERAQEVKGQVLPPLRENAGKVSEAREEAKEAIAAYRDAVDERNREVSRAVQAVSRARPDQLPDDVETEPFRKVATKIEHMHVEYEPVEQQERVYVTATDRNHGNRVARPAEGSVKDGREREVDESFRDKISDLSTT